MKRSQRNFKGERQLQPSQPFCLFSEETLRNPYPVYDRMRTESPVFRSPELKGWVFTRHADAQMILGSMPGSGGKLLYTWTPDATEPVRLQRFNEIAEILIFWLVSLEGEEHTRVRRLVGRGFKGHIIEAMRGVVRGRVQQVFAGLPDAGQLDFVSDVAWPVTINVLSEMFGLKPEMNAKISQWARQMAPFLQSRKPDLPATNGMYEALTDMRRVLIDDIFADARKNPKDDVIGNLVAAADDGDRLSDRELLAVCTLLLYASYKSVSGNITIGLNCLLTHPEQLQLLREQPDLIGGAVEEGLRFEGSAHYMTRIADRPFEIDGIKIQEGEYLYPCVAAANRDPAVFVDPARFDITRNPNPHLTFGKGRHFCIGAQLGRLVIQETLGLFVNETADLSLVRPVSWDMHLNSRAPLALDIHFKKKALG